MSDERLKEIVGNFLYDLENMSAHERRTLRPCNISKALDQFAHFSYADTLMMSAPLDIPKWQLCLWMSHNLQEYVRVCDADDFHTLACSGEYPISEHNILTQIQRYIHQSTDQTECAEPESEVEEEEVTDDY